ncbi:DUF4124 domain-containing protein [Dyella mobilis]|uniref:DUF4124 domain-containing protein n=1 Tax=Dyella mobilis TaxID=1849582 RepID=A0ABS2KEG0_9GAMM|nr:DUF4124 domain-containing protein [Dyella mobilis]MBM7129558.1 DUF4124 domain-containing protein [Dyella mobilis]GLQ98179.1 hypothetical protein GCM10007863_25990 [Dyella mobilis]
MRFYLFAILSLFAVAAHGQSIFKCKLQDGSTAYQDHPCPGATNTKPTMTITPDDATSPKQEQSLNLTPEQRARLEQSLERLKVITEEISAKQAQMRRAAQQSGSADSH